MATPTASLLAGRYRLHELLGAGGMGAVYRATDALTGQQVALKRVLVEPDQLAFGSATTGTSLPLALAREFQILASLRHPHIVSVLDYGFDDGQPFFTMRLLDQPQTLLQAGHDLTTAGRVALLVQLLQALAYLHQRGILHRDLKPGNVLVENGHVWVLDFGLAVERGQTADMGGTLAYMAPEVLRGETATRQTDLYAVGVIAYELLAGHHPFQTATLSTLIAAILHDEPDLSPLRPGLGAEPDIEITLVDEPAAPPAPPPGDLAQIIAHLLAKTPAARPGDASTVIARLCAALGQPVPPESAAIRESFLQAAHFVGRHQELTHLNTAWHHARQGQGSAWLVGGESGVGKSRLLNELRTRALVTGALVLQGQAVLEGGPPYALWREPLRRLALTTPLSDLQAASLHKILPDLNQLLQRDWPPAPELDGKAEQQRLLSTILDVFQRQSTPIVLLLEDVQWAGAGLEALRQLVTCCATLPLLIIASYRDDERPRLPAELPGTHLLKLQRLSEAEIAELSTSMLGEVGHDAQIIDLLDKETEGNAFFMVEVIRALAEEAGGLAQVGQRTLPQRVFARGIHQIVQRRLARVPPWAYRALQVAAVAGRALDLKLLATILNGAGFDLQNWLLVCADAAILEVQEERWRFAHDRLREQLLADLEATTQAALHAQVAAGLERTYPGDATPAAALAEHWGLAGQPAKEGHYAFIAGQQAIAVGAVGAAISHFHRALHRALDGAPRAPILLALGDACRLHGDYAAAARHYEKAQAAALSAVETSRALLGRAWVQQTQGQFQLSADSASQAETLLRGPEVAAPIWLAEALYHKGWALFELGQAEAALALGREGLALSSTAQAPQMMARHLNLLGTVEYHLLGQFAPAAAHLHQALALHREIGDRHGEAILLNNLGENARLQGHHDEAAGLYEAALTIARAIGDQDGEMAYLSNLGGALVGRGDEAGALAHLTALLNRVPADWYALSETLRFLAEARLGLGDLAGALAAAQAALQAAHGPDDQGRACYVLGRIAAQAQRPVAASKTALAEPAPVHFARSIEILTATDMPRDRALAQWAWARYERARGNPATAAALWQAAHATLHRLHLTTLLARLEAETEEPP